MTPEQRDKKLALIKNQCEILMASFDTVQIFATKVEKEEDHCTAQYAYGNGNWFARYGHVNSWIIAEEFHLSERDERT